MKAFVLLVALLCLLLPATAAAQTTLADAARTQPVPAEFENVHRPLTIAAIGQGLDIISTCGLLATGKFREGNPWLPKSCRGIAAFKTVLFVGTDLSIHALERRDPRRARTLARVAAVASWVPVVWNGVQVIRYVRR